MHRDFSVDGDLLFDGHVMQRLVLQPLQMLQICPHIFEVLPLSSFGIVFVGFQEPKRALFEVLSTKSSTKRRKNEGRSKHLIQILRALSYQP